MICGVFFSQKTGRDLIFLKQTTKMHEMEQDDCVIFLRKPSLFVRVALSVGKIYRMF
jgi:hypothetical protein